MPQSKATSLGTIVNIATILASLAVLVSLVLRIVPGRHAVEGGLRNGISAQRFVDIDYKKGTQTLVLGLNSGCSFCKHDFPFYKRLSDAARVSHKTELVAVFPDWDSDAQAVLVKNGIQVDKTLKLTADREHIRATPTLILVDKSGVITDFWVGVVPTSEQDAILKRL